MLFISLSISAITILQFYTYGLQNRKIGPITGAFVSIAWMIYTSPFLINQPGLYPLNIITFIIHIYNFIKARKYENTIIGH